jgi:hypothetical protein
MARTTPEAVEILLGFNYATMSQPSLTPYIDTASNIVDRLIGEAALIDVSIGGVTAELIERWLSCYFYCIMDPLYTSKSTDKASGGWEARSYKEAAIALDPSGLLAALLDPKLQASGSWLGKTDAELRDYDERM